MSNEIAPPTEAGSPSAVPVRWVYVVDDDRGMRASLTPLLRAMGFEVRPFGSGDDLLAELEELTPGVLLIDVRMPGIDGIELIAGIRAQDCHWPVAIMTGHGEIPLAVRAIRRGAYDFLEKPFAPDVLERVMLTGFEMLPATVARCERVRAARRISTSLSARQREIFTGVTSGLTSKQIALEIGISHRTVEAYRLDMMHKLGVRNMVELFEVRTVLEELEDGV